MASVLTLVSQATPTPPSTGKISIYMDSATFLPYYEDSAGGTHQFLTGSAPTISGANITAGSIPDTALSLSYLESLTTVSPVTNLGDTRNPNLSLAASSVSNSYLANAPANTIKGNNTGALGALLDLTAAQVTAMLNPATTTLQGALAALDKLFISKFNAAVVLVTANSYQNLACDGATDDSANLNALYAAAPSGSVLLWPPCTMVLSSGTNPSIPSGKHFHHAGAGEFKTIFLSASQSADFITCGDWQQTFEGITFNGNATTLTGAAVAIPTTGGVTLTIAANSFIPGGGGAGSCYVNCQNVWTLVNFTGSTTTSLTGCTTAVAATTTALGAVQFKTGGYAINGGSNVYINTRDCAFTAVYNGIIHNGTLCATYNIQFSGTINFDNQCNGANVNSILHNITCDGAPAAISHCEVNQCGSLLISDCDWIRALNNMRLNPTSPNGVFGVYAVNTYFDTAGQNGVQIVGTGNVQRVKILNSWMSSAALNGLQVASTAATLPTGIDVVNCDIYSNGTSGVVANGCQDIGVSLCRIAGNGIGIVLNASAGSVTELKAIGNRIGPTGGIGANTTGITINSGAYGALEIYNNNLRGNTTAITDNSTSSTAKNITNNVGMAISGQAKTAATAGLNTTETVIATAPVGTGGLLVGTVYRARLPGTCTATAANASTFTLRYGTTGTTADAAIATAAVTSAATGTAVPFDIEIFFTVTNIGSTGAVSGWLRILNGTSATTGITGLVVAQVFVEALTPTSTLNTTLNGIMSVTYKSAATTTTSTFNPGVILEAVQQA
jgi:hypothetical protein